MLILLLMHATVYCMEKKESPKTIHNNSETKKTKSSEFNTIDPEDEVILHAASIFAGFAWIAVIYYCKKYFLKFGVRR